MSSPEDEAGPDEGQDDEPLEEVGPQVCAALPAQCDVAPGERDQPPEECTFTKHDELSEQFPVETIPVVIAPDGMSQPVDVALSFAPPFTHEHVVCIEDRRTYVELFDDELKAKHWSAPDFEGKYPDLSYYYVGIGYDQLLRGQGVSPRICVRDMYGEDGQPRERETYKPEQVHRVWGIPCVKIAQGSFRPVRPIRERCKYYKRQVFNNDEQPDPNEPGHRIYFTNCTKRRSVGGAFMSLRDQAVYACDYRNPPDPKTEAKHLDAFDEKRLTEKGHETLVPMFGLGGDDLDVSK